MYRTIGLVPDTEVLELAVDLAAGDEHLPHVPPAHADLMDRAVDGVLGETPKHRFQTRSRRRAISVPLFGALLDLINRESRIRGAGCERLMAPPRKPTASLIQLGEWLEVNGCTHVAMEATGKPISNLRRC